MRILKNNPNRQDTMLGGLIVGGFVVVAVIAALYMLFSWRVEQTADVPKTADSSAHSLPHLPQTDTSQRGKIIFSDHR